MLLRFLVLVLLLLPVAARAQLVEVQSGEHPGFSRLALTFPKEVDWQFGRTPDGYELRVPDKGLRFDLSTVFTFIPRDRLSAVWVDPATGTLRMTLRCACHGTAFALQPRIVVIDLVDGPPIPGSGFETAIDAPDGPVLRPLVARSEPRPRPRPASMAEASIESRQSPEATVATPPSLPTVVEPFAAIAAPSATAAASRPVVPFPLPSTDPRAVGLQGRLLAELSRAASRGLVEPSTVLPADSKRPDVIPMGAPLAAPAVQANQPEQLRVLTDAEAMTGDLTAKGAICLPEADLAVQTWGDDTPLPVQIATRRSGIVGEFDIPDQAMVLGLARLYLYAGFGAEAQAILATFAPDAAEMAVVRGLAAALDGTEPATVFAGMEVCDNSAALWAVLSQPNLKKGDKIAEGAISRTFSALPLHLRRHLGPRLVERLIAIGYSSSAQAIRDAIGRAPGDHGAALGMIDARIDLDRGNVAEAEEKLGKVVADDGPLSPEALVALVNSVIDRGGALDPNTLTALEAVERETRNTAESHRVRLALTRALAAAGAFDRAFKDSEREDPRNRAAIWPILAARGGDGDILRHALAAPSAATVKEAGPAALMLADRLIQLGFPDAALRWVVPDETDTARITMARAAIGLRDGRAALQALSGLDGDAAADLRVRAHQILGQTDQAVAALMSSDRTADAVKTAWQAQDWDGVRALGAAEPDNALALGSLSLTAVPPVDASNDDLNGPLARGRSLLSASDQTRKSVDDLMRGIPALDQN